MPTSKPCRRTRAAELPSNELVNGSDNPDVNDLNSSRNGFIGTANEALLFAGSLLAGSPHPLPRDRLDHDAESVNLKAKTSRTEATTSGQSQGRGPGAGARQRRCPHGEAVILQFLGDRSSVGEVLPPLGKFRRYRVLELVNFITTELHKSFGLLFNPEATDEISASSASTRQEARLCRPELGSGPFLMGDELTIPDPYLFVITGWTDKFIGLDRWPSLTRISGADLERPSVRHVMRFEGLLEEEPAG